LARATTQVKILVPGDQSMVALLGQRDELLKLIEAAFDSVIVVRGNEITITGPEEEAERVGVLFEELLSLLVAPLSHGQMLSAVESLRRRSLVGRQLIGEVHRLEVDVWGAERLHHLDNLGPCELAE